jgi:hypothetical protein
MLYKWKERLESKAEEAFTNKNGRSILCNRAQVKYAFIREQRSKHSLDMLCSTLGVPTNGYHDWLNRPMSKTAKDNCRLITKYKLLFVAYLFYPTRHSK